MDVDIPNDIKYSALEIYTELINEKKGEKPRNDEH